MCHDPVANGDFWVVRRRRTKDTIVGIKRLLRRDVDQNRGVGAQRHRDDRCGWAEELGQRCGGVRNPYALVPEYQGDNI